MRMLSSYIGTVKFKNMIKELAEYSVSSNLTRDYFQKTGIFPIMHTVVLRPDIYEKYPWVAQSLYKAFCQAKKKSLDNLRNLGAPPVALPWFFHEIERTISIMGEDFWPYGFKQNQPTISKLVEYMKQQGLISEANSPDLESLFARNTID